jgi:hypothetical protein
MRQTNRCEYKSLALCFLLTMAGSHLLAQPGLTTFEATETICAVTPGKLWVTDGATLHIRGQVNRNIIQSSEPRLNGTNTAVLSVNFNLTTLKGTANGTFMITPDTMNGTWEGTGIFRVADGKAVGTAVGHGTGAFEGHQIRLELEEVVASGNPPCQPVGPGGNVQTKIRGVIFDPNGK